MAINRKSDLGDGRQSVSTGKLLAVSGWNVNYNVQEKLYDVREMIDNHVDNIRSNVTDNVKQTIRYLQKVLKRNEKMSKTNAKQKIKLDSSLKAVRRIWDQVALREINDSHFDNNLNSIRDVNPAHDTYEIRITKGEELSHLKRIKTQIFYDH